MYVAETIMMTSSTRTTSTIGVTLIPTMGARPRPPPDCIVPAISSLRRGHGGAPLGERLLLFLRLVVARVLGGDGLLGVLPALRREAAVVLEQRQELLADRGDVPLDLADPLLEDVEGDDRGDGDDQAHARGDER